MWFILISDQWSGFATFVVKCARCQVITSAIYDTLQIHTFSDPLPLTNHLILVAKAIKYKLNILTVYLTAVIPTCGQFLEDDQNLYVASIYSELSQK